MSQTTHMMDQPSAQRLQQDLAEVASQQNLLQDQELSVTVSEQSDISFDKESEDPEALDQNDNEILPENDQSKDYSQNDMEDHDAEGGEHNYNDEMSFENSEDS